MNYNNPLTNSSDFKRKMKVSQGHMMPTCIGNPAAAAAAAASTAA